MSQLQLQLCTGCGAMVSSLAGTKGSHETTNNPTGLATEHEPDCPVAMVLTAQRAAPAEAAAPPAPSAPLAPAVPPPSSVAPPAPGQLPKVPAGWPADWPLPAGYQR